MKRFVAVLRSPLALFLFLCFAAGQAAAKPYVCMQTNVGEICMELFPEAAPQTVANFLKYVDEGDYSNSMIHRSVPGFVIQGGGYTLFSNLVSTMSVDPPVVNEYNQSNLRGTVAMARIGGSVNSATSQWFINLADNTNLDTVDGGFTVFARVVKGMDIVDAIAALTRYNMTSSLGSAFNTVPSTAPVGAEITANDLIRVITASRTDFVAGVTPLPYQCSATSPGNTLTEFCGSSLTFPVSVDGKLFEGTIVHIPGRAGLVFKVAATKLLADTGQERAAYAAGVLTIPSVRIGTRIFDNVKLNLTSSAPLELTLSTYTER
ncbi:MAG: peptidylprolyl isomerase [Pseudomonadota bacterium]